MNINKLNQECHKVLGLSNFKLDNIVAQLSYLFSYNEYSPCLEKDLLQAVGLNELTSLLVQQTSIIY